MKRSRAVIPVLALLAVGALAPPAGACCAPCAGICGPETPPDTVCCTGDPSPCDGCGHTACGACRWEPRLDRSCASLCDQAFLNCRASPSEESCEAAFGECFDGCTAGAMVCDLPPCPADCVDDRYEQDDTALEVLSQAPVQGLEPVVQKGRVALRGDVDLIAAYAGGGGPAGVEVLWDPSEGGLSVALLDARGRPMDLSSPGDVRRIAPGRVRLGKAGYEGRFYVRVLELGLDDVIACVRYQATLHAVGVGP